MSKRWALALVICALAHAAPRPADWVPARWPWNDAASLELLKDSAINCLLVREPTAEFVAAANGRGLVTLAVLKPGVDGRKVLATKVTGLVLEGDFPAEEAAGIRAAAGTAPVVELTSRARLKLGDSAPIYGTHQGVWPGINMHTDGAKKAGPTGSIWIDTNTGFIRAARAWGGGTLWLGNEPPPRTLVTTDRYLQVIADAAISGARWIVALDSDFAARIPKREAGALNAWRRINEMLAYFERHPEWRAMREFGQLAVVQDPAAGGLLSGGILDMIAVEAYAGPSDPGKDLSPEALKGATMAVNVDPDALTAEQKEVLRAFTRAGNTMLSGPPGWKKPSAGQITLELEEGRVAAPQRHVARRE